MRGAIKSRMLVALAAITAGTAQAQSPREVIEDARLVGIWQEDCRQPASPRNVRSVYAVDRSGAATLTYDSGAGSQLWVIRILSARRLGPDRIAYLSEAVTTKQQLDITLMLTGGRIRIWTSRQVPQGKLQVENGIVTSNRQPSPLQIRCS